MDLTLIEVMPLGEIETTASTSTCRCRSCARGSRERYTLEDLDERTGGPARYVRVKETGGRLGFITPLTHNFCESCNRVRLTCTGTLYMCLGQEDAADLRTPLARLGGERDASSRRSTRRSRASPRATTSSSTARNRPAVARHMSVTGG